jgi:UDP-N-acetylglucosamine 2-epimerase
MRVLIVVGTRPEAIKLAPVILELRRRPSIHTLVCATGQHREMLDSALRDFDIAADRDLNVMTSGQHPTFLLARLLVELQKLLEKERPDWVIVQGDTTSVAAGGLAAFLHGAKVAHVEAGLRTRDRRAPFPEEVNRRITSVVADLHFAPTELAQRNLLNEGIEPAAVLVTGNTVIDALHWMEQRVGTSDLPGGLDADRRRFVLVTAHRRESFGAPFREVCLALREIAEHNPNVLLVYPVHLNPNVRGPVREILSDATGVKLIDPVSYRQMVALLKRCEFVITDSGGLQEEAPALGKPVLVLREKTERPEAVAAGVVKLVGTDRSQIVSAARQLLTDAGAYREMARRLSPYGDGLAAARIVDALERAGCESQPSAAG